MNRIELSMKPSVSEVDTIQALLLRFATSAAVLARERSPLPYAPEDRLKTILREIDETVLPKRINLKVNGNVLAYLDVSNRHLVSLTRTTKSGSIDDPDRRGGEHFANCLLDISKAEGTMTSHVGQRLEFNQEAEGSCSVQVLKLALGFDEGKCRIQHFERLLEGNAVALLRWEDDPEDGTFAGDEDCLTLLKRHVLGYLRVGNEIGAGLGFRQTQPDGILIPLSRDQAIVLVQNAERGIAAVVQMQEGLEAINKWQIAGFSRT